jgi:hypothetical protein
MRIAFIITTVTLLGCAMPIDAQIVPPSLAKPAAVADSTMVFQDRGQQLEVYPTLRATPGMKPGTSSIEHRLSKTEESTPMGPGNLGVVFNHSLQARGYLTGEIAFKPKGDGPPVGFDAASYPGLTKVTNPNIHVVVASSPREFLALFNRLRSRTDLEWVEAVVIYGAAADNVSLQPPRRDAKPSH